MLAEPERDTLALLCHPFYDRDSEAAPWRGLIPPYDVEPDDEPDYDREVANDAE